MTKSRFCGIIVIVNEGDDSIRDDKSNTIRAVIVVISLMITVLILICSVGDIQRQLIESQRYLNELDVVQDDIIDMQDHISMLEAENKEIQGKNEELLREVEELRRENQQLRNQSNKGISSNVQGLGIDTSKKTYMDYRSITDRNSRQWDIQGNAYTDEDGLRVVEGCYCVALGGYKYYRKLN